MKTWQLRLALFLLFFFIFYIYLVFISYSYNFDGVVFSQFLRYAVLANDLKTILAPHHLLYFPTAFISFKLVSMLPGYHMLEYFHLQLMSLFFGILTLVFIYKIFKSCQVEDFYRILGIFVLAFSFLFWFLSIETEVHMPGFFFMVSGLYFLFFKESNLRNTIISALLLSLSAGFHLTNGLILFSAAAFFVCTRVKIKRALQFYSFYGLFLALPYLWLKLTTGIDLVSWARDTLVGKSAFTGYVYSGTRFSRWRGLSLHSLSDSLGAVKGSILKANSHFLSLLSLMIMIIMLMIILYHLKKASPKGKILYFIFWVVPFFLFFTLWQPGNYEFKLNVVVPFLMVFVLSLSCIKGQKIVRPLFLAFCVSLFMLNFYTTIKPMHNIQNNTNYLISQAIKEKTEPGSFIVIAGTGKNAYLHGKIYIPYFALRETIILDWRLGKGFTFDQIAHEIADNLEKGKGVYFLSEVSSLTETMRDILDFHQRDEAEFIEFLQKFKFADHIQLSQDLFLLKPGKPGF